MLTATLIVFGIMLGSLLTGTGLLMYYLLHQLRDTATQVGEAVKALEFAAKVFGESANVSEGLIALVAVQRRSISALESMTASIKTFTGIVLRDGPPPEAPPDPLYQSWRPGGPPPPPNPAYEENATTEEAGYMEQDDEVLAEIERQNQLREQGIETDPLRVHMPGEDEINRG